MHYDHIYGLNGLTDKFPRCKVYTNEFGRNSLTDSKFDFSRYYTEVEDFVFSYPKNVVVVGEGEKMNYLKVYMLMCIYTRA